MQAYACLREITSNHASACVILCKYVVEVCTCSCDCRTASERSIARTFQYSSLVAPRN